MNLVDLISDKNLEKRIEVQERINDLGRIQRAVLHLWVEGYTQDEIANMFGYTQPRISQILANIYKKPLPVDSK